MSDSHGHFDAAAIQRGLKTSWLGKQVLFFPVIGSTNEEARRMATSGAIHGTLLIADMQTAGRGRMARRWVAPAGSSLLLSLILRPTLAPTHVQRVTMACGLAGADALEEVAGVAVGLKWPNDILIGERKVAGILTEMSTIGDQIDFLVVGIGINVNLDPADLAPACDTLEQRETLVQDPSLRSVAEHATSLQMEAGRIISRLELLWRFLERLEFWYARIPDYDLLHRAWSRKMCLVGRCVQVDMPGETVIGRVAGVDQYGALLLDTATGMQKRILAGDVSLR